MAGGYVEYFVCHMTEEGGDLGGSDEAALPHGVIAMYRGRAVWWRRELLCLPYDVQAGLGGAHPVRVQPAPVGEALAVVREVKVMASSGVAATSCMRHPVAEEKLKSFVIRGSALGRSPQLGLLMVAKMS